MSMNTYRHQPLRLLVVEDNQDDFLLLLDHLEGAGLRVDAMRVDSEKDLAQALSQNWDLICSDYSMPSLSGARALTMVRKVNQDTPFIFVSGTIGEAAAVQAIKTGAQDYVMKSDLARLVPTVERELREANARREQRKAEDMLRKLSLAMKQTADSVFITNSEGLIEYVNPAFEDLTGYTLSEAIGCTPALLRSEHHELETYRRLWETISDGRIYNGTLINRRKDGSEFYEEKVISPLYDDNGSISHFVSTGRDITDRIQAEQARQRLSSILEATPDLVAILQPDGRMLYLNSAGHALLGLDPARSVLGQPFIALFPETLAQHLNTQILPAALETGHWTGETWITPTTPASNGLPVSLVVLAHVSESDQAPYFSLVARDISERKHFEAELQHQATHDSLTNLPNRYFLMDRLEASLQSARRRNKSAAILFLDMDKFKRVNDNLGHATGDELLKQVAQRLRSCMRPTDTIARLGGDEFTVVIEDLERPENVIAVLSKFYRVFKLPVRVETQEVFVTFSIGIALYPQDGTNSADLLRHADIAMYRAKSQGSNQYQFYAPDMDSRGREILQMDADLRYAITNNELCLFYQPQVNVATGKPVGVEALIRWRSPSRGLVSPADFVPLLESSGLIIKVGEWVIAEACKQYHRFKKLGYSQVRVSANVSAVQFQDPEFKDKVIRLVQKFQLPPQALELEVTENIVMQAPARAADILLALNKFGVRIAIDDFGTGYSSLAYLKRFPISTLKIDQTFVRDITVDPSDAAIVEASISLAHKLGMEVVAEGVETETQFSFLQRLNCNLVQGYLFSKPVAGQDIGALMGQTFC